MGDQADEKRDYSLTPEGEGAKKSSRDFTGKATALYPQGDEYTGMFENGMRHGNGVYKYKNGNIYEGESCENLCSGIGKMTYTGLGDYYGRFVNGKRHGEGVFNYSKTKDIYSGSWVNGKKHGKGTYIYDDTRVKIKGNWDLGEIIEGSWIFPNGTFFVGHFEKNHPKGLGMWNFANGNKISGEFSHYFIDDKTKSDNTVLKLNWKTNAEPIDINIFQTEFVIEE